MARHGYYGGLLGPEAFVPPRDEVRGSPKAEADREARFGVAAVDQAKLKNLPAPAAALVVMGETLPRIQATPLRKRRDLDELLDEGGHERRGRYERERLVFGSVPPGRSGRGPAGGCRNPSAEAHDESAEERPQGDAQPEPAPQRAAAKRWRPGATTAPTARLSRREQAFARQRLALDALQCLADALEELVETLLATAPPKRRTARRSSR